MAENLDTPSLGNFSIENTMEMGPGSAELLNDLMSPETSTGNPDDIQKIVKDAEPPAADPKPDFHHFLIHEYNRSALYRFPLIRKLKL